MKFEIPKFFLQITTFIDQIGKDRSNLQPISICRLNQLLCREPANLNFDTNILVEAFHFGPEKLKLSIVFCYSPPSNSNMHEIKKIRTFFKKLKSV